MEPSLVTWPTRTTGTPLSLEKCTRRAAASRTWATPPGVPPTSAAATVWMESTTSRSGRIWSAAATMASTSRSAASSTRGWASPGARPAGRPGRPIPRRWPPGPCPRPRPGRPPPGAAGWTCPPRARRPTSSVAPGTRPPPSTRSTSSMPVRRRTASSGPMAVSGSTRAARGGAPRPGPAGTSVSGAEPPQPGQKPIHLGLVYPQASHR